IKEAEIYHNLSTDEILKNFDSGLGGLSSKQVSLRKAKYGSNEITEKKSISPFLVFLKQFKSLMVYVLLVAAGISLFLGRIIDVYVIVFVIFVNSIIGFSQDYKAEKAIKALKQMIVPQARLLRDNELIQIPARDLVPGDIIILEEGDRIPADARLIEIKNFRTVESSLTGESFPVDKFLKNLPEKTPLADRKNMVWLGTFVASGKAKAIVVSIGDKTTLGRLAKSIEQIEPKKSHFQTRTDQLAKQLAVVSFVGAIIAFLIGYLIRGLEFSEIFLFSIASLVAAIPEGLPAVLAIVLAIGSFRMAKRNAIVREKYATETLGVVDTIITDKTGTLTQNTMSIKEIYLPGQSKITVEGSGWEPKGTFFQNKKSFIALENKHLNKLLHISAMCNNSRLYKEEVENKQTYKIIGDPTEAALLVLAERAGLKKSTILQTESRIDDFPFNSSLKYHASLSVLSDKGEHKEIYVIGAPEAVINKSTYILKNGRKAKLISEDSKKLESKIDSMTGKAMRVLALAYREVPSSFEELQDEDARDLVLVGVVGMIDPPREEVKSAIEKARRAGIRTIMATGDHKNTAIAIAREIGLVKKQIGNFPLALTGQELSELSEKEFNEAVRNVSIFARLTPELKLRIAKTLQKHGKVVAMTGDGVNDAPALKQADMGISMGIIGTDVARESSGMILADDNFASIINAIEEGRTVFINTRQTSFFLVTTGIAQYATIIATMLIGMPLPLLPTQVLWLNLVSGGVTDVALASEQSHHEVLNEKPRNKNEGILNKEILPFLVLITISMLLITLFVFNYYLPDESKARTAAFSAMSFTQLFSMLNLRSIKNSLFKLGAFTNKYVVGAFIVSSIAVILAIYSPFLRGVFEFFPLSFNELGIIFLLSSSVLWFGEAFKYLRDKKNLIPRFH
ncbi:MAG: HAD-IC family P-type ATPase, partial [Nanoarchaeota archaeon]|nr:HAD-IC family P-type ATPase [Nanoarchaeota archaeon]